MTTDRLAIDAEEKRAPSPLSLLIAVAASTFAVEIVIMEYYPRWDRGLSKLQGSIADAVMLCLVMVPVLYVAVYRPLRTTIRRLSDALESLRLSDEVVEKTSEGIVIADAGAKILRVNRSFSEITGYAAEEAVGRSTSLLKSGLQDDAFYQDMWASLQAHGEWEGEIWNRKKDGQVYLESLSITKIQHGPKKDVHYVGVFSQAKHDRLTGLANRHVLMNELGTALRGMPRADEHVALLFIDLDGFKSVNDRCGHDCGDRLLQAVGRALKRTLRPGDVAARLGGDEFAVLARGLRTGDDAADVAASARLAIHDAAGRSPDWQGVSASIGVALARASDAADPPALLRRADEAMYSAKRQGKNRVATFTERLRASGSAEP